MKCSRCKKQFGSRQGRGYKIVPKPICQDCVLGSLIIECYNCGKIARRREGHYREDCTVCDKSGCTTCFKILEIGGYEWGFCNEHQRQEDYDMAKEMARDLKEDEEKQC